MNDTPRGTGLFRSKGLLGNIGQFKNLCNEHCYRCSHITYSANQSRCWSLLIHGHRFGRDSSMGLEVGLKCLPCTFQKIIQKKKQKIEPFLELCILGKKTKLCAYPKFIIDWLHHENFILNFPPSLPKIILDLKNGDVANVFQRQCFWCF